MFHKTNKVYSQLVYMYIYRSSVTFLDEEQIKDTIEFGPLDETLNRLKSKYH